MAKQSSEIDDGRIGVCTDHEHHASTYMILLTSNVTNVHIPILVCSKFCEIQ